MNKQVLSAGCSFIYGAELSDSPSYNGDDPPSKLTWPALWAKSHGFNYSTVATCGISNSGISRLVIDSVEIVQPDIVIVQWTYPNRYEIRFNNIVNGNYFSMNHWLVEDFDSIEAEYKSFLQIFKDSPMQKLAHIWYRYVSYYETEMYHLLKEIVFLGNYLKSKDVKFVFTSVLFDEIKNVPFIKDKSILHLYAIAEKMPWIKFENNGFLEWAMINGYFNKSVWKHPGDAAHRKAFNLLTPLLDEQLLNT